MAHTTDPSLLDRLSDPCDDEAWERFYFRYRGLIFYLARSKGLSPEAASDVVQAVMCQLVAAMQTFTYDNRRRFRNFVITITVRVIAKESVKVARKYAAMDRYQGHILDTISAPEDTHPDDVAWERNLVLLAIEGIRERVEPKTFLSFQLYVLQGQSADSVADMLGLNVQTVYQHRKRLIDMLKKEVERVRQDLED